MSDFPLDSLPVPTFGLDASTELPLARGYLDKIQLTGDMLHVGGWMLLPAQPLDSAVLYVNGARAGAADLISRPGIARQFPWIPHAERSGIRLRVPARTGEFGPAGRIDVLGCRDGQPLARISTLFQLDNVNSLVPPVELRERVSGNRDAEFFRVDGLKCCGEFLAAAAPYCDLQQVRRVLDWGCGSGRVTTHLLDAFGHAEVSGCDIDAEAIAWCQTNLPRGHFSASEPFPPLPYADGYFDLIVSYSVFTHLTREAQAEWLAEMQRVCKPGGLFIASTHGPFAAQFAFPESYETLLASGIYDDPPDSRLDGIAPDGFYRLTYQSPAYTNQEFSEFFDVLAYHERSIGNFQDLVVMQQSEAKRAHRPSRPSAQPGAAARRMNRELSARMGALQAEHTTLAKSYDELEQWAQSLERTVQAQQARLDQYDRFPALRWLASKFPRR